MNLQIVKISFKSFKMNYLKSILAIYILGLSIIGCDCSPETTSGTKAIIMKVLDPELLADQKTLRLNFEPAGDISEVNLNDYRLKITLSTDGLGKTKLIYANDTADGLEIDSIAEQPLTYFSNDSNLTLGNAPLELSFDLEIDLGVKQVIIKFELLNQHGILVTDATSVWKGSDKPIELKLERLGDGVLKGADNIVELKITNWGTEKTEANQIKLKITRDKGDTATIAGTIAQQDGSYILDFPNTIDANGAYIVKKIEINSGTDPESAFKIKLIYKGEEHKSSLSLIYKQGEIEIRNLPKRFVGDNVVSFDIFNNTDADIQVPNYTIELVSDNDATFQFVTEKNSIEGNGPIKTGKSVAKIDEVAFTIPDVKLKGNSIIPKKYKISGIGFSIQNPNGQSKAEVMLQLKKGGEIVAVSEKILWEAEGVVLKLSLGDSFEEYILVDNNIGEFKLKNEGNMPVNTEEVQVILTNSEGVNFSLGNITGSNINTNLSKILAKMVPIAPNEVVLFNLKLSNDPRTIDKYGIDLEFKIQYKEAIIFNSKLLWSNQEKVKKIKEQFNNIAKQFTEVQKKYLGPKLHQELIQDNKKDLDSFCERILKIFKIRPEVVVAIPSYVAGKRFIKNILTQEGAKMPDRIREDTQYLIDTPDDDLVQKIDKEIAEAFILVKQRAMKYLNSIKLLAANNNIIEAKKSLKAVQRWSVIADKFAAEMVTLEAKRLAQEVDEYKAEAEKILAK